MSEILSADYVWHAAIDNILTGGKKIAPRDLCCTELMGHATCVDMRAPVVTSPLRKLGYRFMAAEARWILSGRSDLEDPVIKKSLFPYSDDGRFMAGAYGPEVVAQIPYVVDALMIDRDSRQAVISIWRKNPRYSKDIPCTLSLQFLIRDGKLHVVASMRSSDLWLGWPYDVFTFTMIAWSIILQVDPALELGTLILTAGSMHIYDTNLKQAYECAAEPVNDGDILAIDRHGIYTPDDLLACLGSTSACLIDIKTMNNPFFKRLYELANGKN